MVSVKFLLQGIKDYHDKCKEEKLYGEITQSNTFLNDTRKDISPNNSVILAHNMLFYAHSHI